MITDEPAARPRVRFRPGGKLWQGKEYVHFRGLADVEGRVDLAEAGGRVVVVSDETPAALDGWVKRCVRADGSRVADLHVLVRGRRKGAQA